MHAAEDLCPLEVCDAEGYWLVVQIWEEEAVQQEWPLESCAVETHGPHAQGEGCVCPTAQHTKGRGAKQKMRTAEHHSHTRGGSLNRLHRLMGTKK